MQPSSLGRLQRITLLLAFAVIIKFTVAIVLEYRFYFPPRFNADFLQGREGYFWGGYHFAFYSHVIAGPISLLLAVLILSERLRRHHARWHKRLGKIQIGLVLLIVAPSGLVMAYWAEAGLGAQLAFAMLALATGSSAWIAWRFAIQQRFSDHREWAIRCSLLLFSAVVLRILGGLFSMIGTYGDWTYVVSAWVSWVAPLTVFEIARWQYASGHRLSPTRTDST